MAYLGPDVANDMGDLLVVEPLGFLVRETFGDLPAPGERQQMALLLADDLGSRMSGRDVRPGRGREPVNQPIETSVVVGFEDNGVIAEKNLAENQGDFVGFKSNPWPRSGDGRGERTVRPRETWDRWDRGGRGGPSSTV